ncbi:MAG: L,D-transpeptidase family protein [Pseudonocardia sp.]
MMGAHARSAARRSVAARAAVAVALATVAATVLVGVGVAQEAAQVPPVEPSAGGLAAPAPSPFATSVPQPTESRAPRTAVAPEPSASGTAAPATTTREAASDPAAPGSASAPAAPPAGPASSTLVEGTPCTSTARACVDLDERKAWLIDAGKVVRGPVNIGIGDPDDPTPTGTFHVQWKAEQYTSREYLVEMPYSVFFAEGGVAFHEGEPDTRSAGCVKLKHDDAVAWFNFLQVDDEVQVHEVPDE